MSTIINDPSVVIGNRSSHSWEGGKKDKWYTGVTLGIAKDHPVEYEIEYAGWSENVFMELDEMVTDIRNGDLMITWM